MAIELSLSNWKLGFTLGLAQKPREINVPTRNLDRLLEAIASLKRRFIRSQDDPTEWGVVQVPSVEEEDARQLHRELETLKAERPRHINRIKGLLIGQGIQIKSLKKTFLQDLEHVRLWDSSPLLAGLKSRVERECQRLAEVDEQLKLLKKERRLV